MFIEYNIIRNIEIIKKWEFNTTSSKTINNKIKSKKQWRIDISGYKHL